MRKKENGQKIFSVSFLGNLGKMPNLIFKQQRGNGAISRKKNGTAYRSVYIFIRKIF